MHVLRFLLLFCLLQLSGFAQAAELAYNHDGKRGAVTLHPGESVDAFCAKVAEAHGSEYREPVKCFYRVEVITNLPYTTLERLFKKRADGVGYEPLSLPRVGSVASVAPRADPRVAQLEAALQAMTTERDSYQQAWGRQVTDRQEAERLLKSANQDLNARIAERNSAREERDQAREALSACKKKCNTATEWMEGFTWSKPPLSYLLWGVIVALILGAIFLFLRERDRRRSAVVTPVAAHEEERTAPQPSTVLRAEEVRQENAELQRLRGVDTTLAATQTELGEKKQAVKILEDKVKRLTAEKTAETEKAATAETNRLSAAAQAAEFRELYLKERDETVPTLRKERDALQQKLDEALAEIKRMSRYVLGWIERCVLPARIFADEEKGSSTLELWRTDGRLQKSMDGTDPDMWCQYRLSDKYPNGTFDVVQGNLDGSLDCALVLQALRTSPDFRQEVEQILGRSLKPVPSV